MLESEAEFLLSCGLVDRLEKDVHDCSGFGNWSRFDTVNTGQCFSFELPTVERISIGALRIMTKIPNKYLEDDDDNSTETTNFPIIAFFHLSNDLTSSFGEARMTSNIYLESQYYLSPKIIK